jgi:putative transposase
VVRAVNILKVERGLPKRIACDNGSEFAGGQMDLWAYANNVTLDFSRRGKPTDNAIVESFNGRFREECLNTHWFESIEDAKEKIDRWRWDYNELRPHLSLKGLTPREYLLRSLQGVADP